MVYNRIPKTGSLSLRTVLRSMGERSGRFSVVDSTGHFLQMAPSQRAGFQMWFDRVLTDLGDCIARVRQGHGVLYNNHMFYFNVSENVLPPPLPPRPLPLAPTVYINMVN